MPFQQSQIPCKCMHSQTTRDITINWKHPANSKSKSFFVKKLPCLFLEKKVDKKKFESAYNTKPQIAVAGTKPTITTDENKQLQRKRVSKQLKSTIQNPLSRRGKTREDWMTALHQ